MPQCHWLAPLQFRLQCSEFEGFKSTDVSDTQAHDLAIRLYDDGILNLTQIPALLREWRKPRHAEFAEYGNTAWRLFNAATETLKGDWWRLPTKTGALHRSVQSLCVDKREEPKELLIPAESALCM